MFCLQLILTICDYYSLRSVYFLKNNDWNGSCDYDESHRYEMSGTWYKPTQIAIDHATIVRNHVFCDVPVIYDRDYGFDCGHALYSDYDFCRNYDAGDYRRYDAFGEKWESGLVGSRNSAGRKIVGKWQLFVIRRHMKWNEHIATLTNYFERRRECWTWSVGSCLATFETLDAQLIRDFIRQDNTINLLLRFANNDINSLTIQAVIDPSGNYLNYLFIGIDSSRLYLQALPTAELTLPVLHCAVFTIKGKNPLSPESRLGSQVCMISLTDQDLSSFVLSG